MNADHPTCYHFIQRDTVTRASIQLRNITEIVLGAINNSPQSPMDFIRLQRLEPHIGIQPPQ
jgi:hypothetical protein